MKTLSTETQKLVYLLFIGLTFNSCDSESTTGPDPVLEALFVGIFDNTWEVQADSQHRIGIFRVGSLTSSSGALDGFEEHDDPHNERAFNDGLNGNFDGRNIEFTIERPSGTVNYSGTMTPVSDEDSFIIRIELTSNNGGEDIVLVREP